MTRLIGIESREPGNIGVAASRKFYALAKAINGNSSAPTPQHAAISIAMLSAVATFIAEAMGEDMPHDEVRAVLDRLSKDTFDQFMLARAEATAANAKATGASS
jgi:hypothetical protein